MNSTHMGEGQRERRWLSPIGLVLLLAVVTNLHAGSPEALLFGDLPTVITPARAPQDLREAPATVNVYSSCTIESWGARSIADLLRRVPGTDLRQFGRYHMVGPRGTANVLHIYNVLILLNGIPVNDPLFGTFDLGPDFPVDIIDTIEVVRGPGSSLYGANAYAGVINLITRTGATDPGTVVRGDAGQGGTMALGVSHGRPFLEGEQLIMIRGDTTRHRDRKAVTANDEFQDFDAFVDIRSQRLEGSAWFSSSEQDQPYTEFAPGTEAYHTNQNRFMRLQWTIDSDRDRDLRLRLHGISQRGTFSGELPDERESFAGERIGLDLQFTLSRRPGRRTIAGIEYTDKSGHWIAVGGDHSSQERAVYLQEELTLGNDWRLTIGGRIDDDSLFGSTVAPRITALHAPHGRRSFRASWGRAFRAPTYSEQFIDRTFPERSVRALGDPDLQPEEVTTLEGSLRLNPSADSSLQFTVFRSKYEQRIKNLPPDFDEGLFILRVANVGRGTTRGIESSLTQRFSSTAEATFSWTHQKARDSRTGEPLAYAPRNTGNLTLTTSLTGTPWRAFVGIRTVSSRQETLETQTHRVPGFTTTDLSVARPLSANLDLRLSIYNLTDRSYEETFGYPMPRRTAVLRLISRF